MLARSSCLTPLLLAVVACGFTDDDEAGAPIGGSLTVTGSVVDFETREPITGATTVTTSGLSPAPRITSEGASFTITGIPESSAFQLLASAPPTHRATFSESIVVTRSDVDDLEAAVVSEDFVARLARGFGITPTAATGVLLLQLVDGAGTPRADVQGSQLVIAGGAIGPRFLDADLTPLPNATASTSSGWAVFFEVPPGVVTLGQAVNATVTLDMPTSPINPGAVTLAKARVEDGAPMLPTNVSFVRDVYPIFSRRGCVACHSGGGPGKDLGGLHLDGGSNLAYRELVLERPNVRVNPAAPEQSLVLRYPSREDPPDRHPNVTFTGPADPDYMKLLAWIREGAKND
jgi:hypothetical protein